MPSIFQDDWETDNVSKFRVCGAVKADATRVIVSLGRATMCAPARTAHRAPQNSKELFVAVPATELRRVGKNAPS
jgi:hypothetical protein